MISKLQLFFLAILYSTEIIFCFKIDINIAPKSISVGKSLLVKCRIVDDLIDKSFKTYLTCPFKTLSDFCLSNCDSVEPCSPKSCDRKKIGNQSFECAVEESITSLTYSYQFISLSHSTLQNKTYLEFKCTFKGKHVSGFVNITTFTTTKQSNSVGTTPVMRSTFFNEMRELNFRIIFVLGMLVSLIISFLINVWCLVQFCTQLCSRRKRRHKQKLLHPQNQGETNVNIVSKTTYPNNCQSQYYHPDNFYQTNSPLSVSNNEHNSFMMLYSNLQCLSNTDAIVDSSKSRNSIPRSNDSNASNESHYGLLAPMYGPMVLTPLQFVRQSVNLDTCSYASKINMDTNYLRFQNSQQSPSIPETIERQDSHIYQPLLPKPD